MKKNIAMKKKSLLAAAVLKGPFDYRSHCQFTDFQPHGSERRLPQ